MKIDPTRTVTENLLSLVKEKYPKLAVTADQVTFGDPTPFNDPTGVADTQITMTGIRKKGFKGSVVLKYKRLEFEQVYPSMPTVIPVNVGDTVTTIMGKLKERMALLNPELTTAKNTPVVLPTPTNQVTGLTVTAVENSKVFVNTVKKDFSLTYMLPVVEVTYNLSGNNLNTLTMLGSPTAIADYRLTITGTIGSTSVNTAALTISALPTGSKFTLINKGIVQGHGGVGGNYNSAGGPGGNAIKALMNFKLDTSLGKIYGGGGGGGGSQQGFSLLNLNHLRAAGGGGSGNAVGQPGTGTGLAGLGLQTNNVATAGTTLVGGLGAKTSSMSNTTQYSQGGSGGNPGEDGAKGVASKGPTIATIVSYPGGAAGKAIELGGFVIEYIAGNNSTQVKGLVA